MIKNGLIFLILLATNNLCYCQDTLEFRQLKYKGLNYLIAPDEIKCDGSRAFYRLTSIAKIAATQRTEFVTDTNDLDIAEKVLADSLDNFLIGRLKKSDTTTSWYQFELSESKGSYAQLKEHNRQVITFVVGNKKYLFINLFCEYTTHKIFRQGEKFGWLNAHDGGKCFWQIIIDLTDKRIANAYYNGLA